MRHPLADPIPELKRAAARELAHLLEDMHLEYAAALLGENRYRVAEIRRGKLDRFSLEKLVRLLARMGQRIELRLTQPPFQRAQK